MSNSARPNAVGEKWTYTDDEILGFFPKPWTPRPQQIIAIKKINAAFRAGKRVVALEMPVGGGKSLVCMTFANAAKALGGTHFITCQKILQRQYEHDFPVPAMEILMGRSNYGCTHPDAKPDTDAAHGVCREKGRGILGVCVDEDAAGPDPLGGEGRSVLQRAVALELPACANLCPYWKKLQEVHDHPIALFNFSSFLFQQRIGRFGERNLMVIDEAHLIEQNLMGFVSLELTEWALSIINIRITRDITSKEQFSEWLAETDILRLIDAALDTAENDAEDVPEDLSQAEADALRELQMKLSNFMAYLDKTEWILETVEYKGRRGPERKIVARPLYAKDFAEDLLFRHAERVLVMSGTILDARIWGENIGFKPGEVELIQTPCDFPVENRPIFLTYAGNCARRTLDETKPKLARAVKGIMHAHRGQRGLIHTQSHDLANFLRSEVNDPRFLFADAFDGDKEEMLQAHAEREDSVLVSPGMKEGVDLKGALGRFQILLKVPWPSLGDKVVKTRADQDQKWYSWLTALGACQSLGRVVRSKDDWGWSYILDSGFESFLSHNGQMIPDWIKEAFRRELPKEIRRG